MPALDLHPTFDGRRFTLRGVFRAETEAERKAVELSEPDTVTRCFPETAPSGAQLHHAAVHRVVQRAERAGIPHEHTTAWDAVRIAVDRFRRIERAAARRGRPFRWYKPLELERLRACLEGWNWKGSRLQVAADILTRTVRVHPFPNANHRTSLFLARDYLQAAGIEWPSYSLRGRGAARFHRDAEDFVLQSKYLLRLLRHQRMIQIAFEEGYTHLLLSGATPVPIQPVDLEVQSRVIVDKHRRSAMRLITALTAPSQAQLLEEENTQGLKDWVKENSP